MSGWKKILELIDGKSLSRTLEGPELEALVEVLLAIGLADANLAPVESAGLNEVVDRLADGDLTEVELRHMVDDAGRRARNARSEEDREKTLQVACERLSVPLRETAYQMATALALLDAEVHPEEEHALEQLRLAAGLSAEDARRLV